MSDMFANVRFVYGTPEYWCPECERKTLVRTEQEPYGDGKFFIAVHCNGCPYQRILRDDLVTPPPDT